MEVMREIVVCFTINLNWLHVPYSLDITPPSIITTPYYLHKFAAEVYLSPIYAYMENLIRTEELCDSDEREEG